MVSDSPLLFRAEVAYPCEPRPRLEGLRSWFIDRIDTVAIRHETDIFLRPSVRKNAARKTANHQSSRPALDANRRYCEPGMRIMSAGYLYSSSKTGSRG